jgi:hypothetical protein
VSWTKARSDLALAVRDGADQKVIDGHRRDLRAERLADHIQKVVDSAPPLTEQQLARLAVLLQGGGSNAAA